MKNYHPQEDQTMGKRLREIRLKRDMTQDQVRSALYLGKSMLSHYERGIHKPSISTLIRMAKLYHVSTDYLTGMVDIEHPELSLTYLLNQSYVILQELNEENKKLLLSFHSYLLCQQDNDIFHSS